MNKISLLAIFATAVVGVSAHAQTALINPTTNNGSFETSPAAKTNFTATTSNAAPIAFWGSQANVTDTGTATGTDVAQDGTKGAFEQPGAGIFNLVTTRTILGSDFYTLTFYARSTANPANVVTQPLTVTLYSQAATATGSTYGYAPIRTLATFTPMISNATGFPAGSQYTLTYAAIAGDVGNDIGISITNGATNYNGLDNFVLTVAPVPEPSTYALMFAGIGGLLFVLRARRSLV